MAKKDFSKYSTDMCANEIQTLLDFMGDKGSTVTMGEMGNVVESLHLIKNKVEESEVIPFSYELSFKIDNVLDSIRRASFINVVGLTISGLMNLVNYIESFSK